MITPRFCLEQDAEFLHVTIYAPFTHLEETEIFMDGTDFRFFSKPYYLRLHLPGEVDESERAGGEYEADTNSFKIKCPKRTPGEEFQGLDMITKLLTPAGDTNIKTKVEDLTGEDDGVSEEEDEEEPDWYYEQKVSGDQETMNITASTVDYGYGFNFSRTGVFKNLLNEFQQLLDVKDPDSKTLRERKDERERMELVSFSTDHYLCDLYESEEINEILSYKTVWQTLLCSVGGEKIDEKNTSLAFSPSDQEQLLALPRRVHKLTESEKVPVFLTLLDILYAACYDERINLGESGTESGWCIAKISPSLSSCTKHTSLKQTVRSCIRRSLIYPLYRHWDLALLVWRDVLAMLQVGKAAVIKGLLRVLTRFGETEGYYILSQLYIQDYLVWIQAVPQSHLDSLTQALAKLIPNVEKSDVELELDELEQAAELALQDEEEEELLAADQPVPGVGPVGALADSLESKLGLDSDDESSSEDSGSSSEDSESDSEKDSVT